ncbi:MAG: hypothetical protein AB1664_09220, partial [Thermodesulfobacteriota bacterium]
PTLRGPICSGKNFPHFHFPQTITTPHYSSNHYSPFIYWGMSWLFQETERSVEALIRYQSTVRTLEPDVPLDPSIHVCEFTGFVDKAPLTPGCLLHPTVAGNQGVDFRGLCHYGSMACKSFYCPAWEELRPDERDILLKLLDDWHLYGLVINDLDFVESLFALLRLHVSGDLSEPRLLTGPAAEVLKEMLAWKVSWPWKGDSLIRTSRYFCKRASCLHESDDGAHITRLVAVLGSTFGIDSSAEGAREFVEDALGRFAQSYFHEPYDAR